jgi:hypothetical protein
MSNISTQFIGREDDLRAGKAFKATDSLLSFGDISFAEVAIAGKSSTPQGFAAHIVSLGHILTRIVLSDQLVFLWDEDDVGPWSTYVTTDLRRHCNTTGISEYNPLIEGITHEVINNPEGIANLSFAKDLTEAVITSAPWLTDALPWLAEHAIAETLGLPIAPNPFLTNTYAVHLARPVSTAEQLVRYAEDLRRDVAREYNLLRGKDIYDVQVPAILSAVLRESRTPDEMILIASQMQHEAKGFRDWCRDMDENTNPRDYSERLLAVQEELKRLGGAIGSKETERLHVSAPIAPGFSASLPTPTFAKLINKLNIDIGSSRKVRAFLLPLLTASQQVRNMKSELERVFGVSQVLAAEASDWLQVLVEMERSP